MSVAEIAPRGESFDRTPPHDVAAEQCALGGMLLSKDAISDVMETIRPDDHYRPAHQIIHEAILELYGRGEPADPVTVSDLLNKRGELARVGGPSYLHTLIASVPTAANAGYYARIVRERAILRRLVEVGTRIVQLGYSGDGEADELVDRAQAEVYGVTERRVSEDYLPLSDIMPGALDEIEAIGSHGGKMTGVPTGFADLDALTNGLHAGQMVVIAARPAIGKALALDTPLATPDGWTTMGEVRVGDRLIGADGHPVAVVAATEVMQDRPCYEVEFSDGEVIVADAEHQWLTWTRAARRYDAQTRGFQRNDTNPVRPGVTTEEIARTPALPSVDKRPIHTVQLASPLQLPEADLPMPPYALGAWLGDGHSDVGPLQQRRAGDVEAVGASGLVTVRQRGRILYGLAFPAEESRSPSHVRGLRQSVRAQERPGAHLGPACAEGRPGFVSARAPASVPAMRGAKDRAAPRYWALQPVLASARQPPGRTAHAGSARGQAHPGPVPAGSIPQRRALLVGIMDTDGTVDQHRPVQLAAD